MASIAVNSVTFGYDEHGQPANPTIVFTHSLVWDREMFSDVIEDLTDDFHVINLDQHGHGQTGYRTSLTLEQMADDYAALLKALGLGPVHWAGLSMGGMTGMRLALQHPGTVSSLTLMDTSSRPEMPERLDTYLQLAGALRAGQGAEVAESVLSFFFAEHTVAEQPELVARYREKLLSDRDREGIYQAALAVFNRIDITDRLPEIGIPALIIVGEGDIATPPDRSELLASKIPNARLVVIPDAAHMSATEQPRLVARAIREFLSSTGSERT